MRGSCPPCFTTSVALLHRVRDSIQRQPLSRSKFSCSGLTGLARLILRFTKTWGTRDAKANKTRRRFCQPGYASAVRLVLDQQLATSAHGKPCASGLHDRFQSDSEAGDVWTSSGCASWGYGPVPATRLPPGSSVLPCSSGQMVKRVCVRQRLVGYPLRSRNDKRHLGPGSG